MVVDAINRFLAQPAVANVLDRLAVAKQGGFNSSIDGLVVGISLGIFSSIVLAFQSRRDKDEYAGIKYFIFGVVSFGALVVVSTVAFGIFGFTKGLMN